MVRSPWWWSWSCVLLMAIPSPRSHAADGDLDPTFATGGRLVRSFIDQGPDQLNAVAAMSDGRVVVAGRAWTGATDDVAVARFRSDGSLDPTFHGTGRLLLPLSAGDDAATGLVVLADGRVLICGYAGNGGYGGFVARLRADGTFDATFGSGGIVTVTRFTPQALAQQSDGAVVVVGGGSSFLVARVTSAGVLDGGFGVGGYAEVPLDISPYAPSDRAASAQGVAVQSDGRIVLAGFTNRTSGGDMTAVRLLGDGRVDATFGTSGIVYVDVAGGSDRADGVALQPDGKIVLGGSSLQFTSAPQSDMVVARLLSSGDRDASFAGGGIATSRASTVFGARTDSGLAVAIQPDGHVVVAGWVGEAYQDSQAALCRFRSDGALDGSTVFAGASLAHGLAARSDGRLLLAGESRSSVPLDFVATVFAAVANGGLDGTFAGGRAVVPMGNAEDSGRYVIAAPDGRILSALWSRDAQRRNITIVTRQTADGALDRTFGSGGWVAIPTPGDAMYVCGLALRPDGKIVVGGQQTDVPNGLGHVLLVRLMPDGALDPAFGANGIAITRLDSYLSIASMELQADGRIVVGGGQYRDQATSVGQAIVLRYLADGALDTGFGSGGISYPGLTGQYAHVKAIAFASDGKILAAVQGGPTSANDSLQIRVARLNRNGTVDGSFGVNGLASTAFPFGAMPTDIAIQGDGKPVVVGWSLQDDRQQPYRHSLLARFTPSGSLDSAFGGSGQVDIPSGSGDFETYSLILLPDGRILATGLVTDLTGVGRMQRVALVRVLANGARDAGFGTNGVKVQPDQFVSLGYGSAQAPNGTVLISGSSNGDFLSERVLLAASAINQPFGGRARTLGGRLYARDYDAGGEGWAYHDQDAVNHGGQYRPSEGVDLSTSAAAGSVYLAATATGEWLKYTVTVPATGDYVMSARVAAPTGGGVLHLESGTAYVTNAVAVPNTGGYQNWQIVALGRVRLAAGTHVLRLAIDVGGFNLDYLDFSATNPPPPPPPPPSTFSAKINFQPAAAALVSGYAIDAGGSYALHGSLSYGWNAPCESRERNATADQLRDTLVLMQGGANPGARWEIAVPNGTYRVHVVCGDPSYFDGNFALRVEGALAVTGRATSTVPFREGTVTVTVGDGRLTLSNDGGSYNTKICFVEIAQ
ncbi:MAG: carbohydrate-binding protein [Planctomycetes bacterium]|nr:carbohydrate-binding protein [Planctomycetota bacterium]